MENSSVVFHFCYSPSVLTQTFLTHQAECFQYAVFCINGKVLPHSPEVVHTTCSLLGYRIHVVPDLIVVMKALFVKFVQDTIINSFFYHEICFGHSVTFILMSCVCWIEYACNCSYLVRYISGVPSCRL